MQYYHRYLSFWHLKRYELCARDTNRNLRLFKFVREHARHEQDKRQFDQWRPYVTMMHTRAVATPLVEMSDHEAAVKAIDAGIAGIRTFLEEYQQTERADQCAELTHLVRWREEIVAERRRADSRAPATDRRRPSRPICRPSCEAELRAAIDNERFEDAARLRDELRPAGRVSLSAAAGREDVTRLACWRLLRRRASALAGHCSLVAAPRRWYHVGVAGGQPPCQAFLCHVRADDVSFSGSR